jgi:uncharacterized protein YcfJ
VQEAAAQDAVGGAILGGAAGALIGNALGGTRGAVVGAIVGGSTGAAIAAQGKRGQVVTTTTRMVALCSGPTEHGLSLRQGIARRLLQRQSLLFSRRLGL